MSPGDWVSYGCLDWGPALFHPDDTCLKEQMLAAGSVCQVAGEERDFWVLRFGPICVRLRKELVGGAVVPPPPLVWGDRVRVKPPRTERSGVIRCIGWHFGRRQHLFWIEEDGRPVKARYFAAELAQVSAEPS